MRVGLMTSWRVPCGIYQYTSRLADAMAQIPGMEVVILAGRADEHRSVPEESNHEVHDIATIGLWRDDGHYSVAVDKICGVNGDLDLDVIHVQYQSMLFTEPDLLLLSHCFNGSLAITFHDRCQSPTFPYEAFNLKFSHRWGTGPRDAETIDMGIEDRPPVIRTFGLGRTRADLIAPVCERNGWVFENAASHEPIHGGGQVWRTHEDLIEWLRGADAIVLWYDPEAMAGSSLGARTAMAARRPVYVNRTEWFSDLPETSGQPPYLRKCNDFFELETALRQQFTRPYAEANAWTKVAAKLVDRYARDPVLA